MRATYVVLTQRLVTYLEHEDPRVERQPHPGRLVHGGGGSAAEHTAAAAAAALTLAAARHRRQLDLEHARLVQQALTLEPGPPHRVGACELTPPAAGVGGAEDIGRALQEVEGALDGGHAGETGGACTVGLPAVVGSRVVHLAESGGFEQRGAIGLSACRQCDQPPHRGERCILWVARLSTTDC